MGGYCSCSLTGCVIKNHKWKIGAYFFGFPGCTHNTKSGETDTKSESRDIAIDTYNSQAEFFWDKDEQMLNTRMSSPCVSTDTIGL
ncbi:hypothetical protein ACHAW6_002366 [Cyclotella cf. meneghiniana]